MKKTNNKGFSLVELIVVIAIMAVLVGVMAPQFLKYVEKSRRAKDIQLANSIQTAYLADIADSTLAATDKTFVAIAAANKPTTLASAPVVSGKLTDYTTFYVYCDSVNGTVDVYIGKATGATVAANSYKLTDEAEAKKYKDA